MGYVVKALTLFAVMLAPAVSDAAIIELRFDAEIRWRYDLSADQFDRAFTPVSYELIARIDDTKVGSEFYPDSGSTLILFGTTDVSSPFWTIADPGFDISDVLPGDGVTIVQDAFITESNQGTWTYIRQPFFGDGGTLGRGLQYTDDPRLSDPAGFGSDELLALFLSHIGKHYGYREDSIFPGGGFQHGGSAVLHQVTLLPSAVPEPGAVALLGLGLAGLGVLGRRRKAA